MHVQTISCDNCKNTLHSDRVGRTVKLPVGTIVAEIEATGIKEVDSVRVHFCGRTCFGGWVRANPELLGN